MSSFSMVELDSNSSRVQKAKAAVLLIAIMAVNAIYGNGKQCVTDKKEELALAKYLTLVADFILRKGRFTDVDEVIFRGLKREDLTGSMETAKKVAKLDESGQPMLDKKNKPVMVNPSSAKVHVMYTAHQIWDRGMKGRRDLVDPIKAYGRSVKLEVRKPAVGDGEGAPGIDECEADVAVPSGGSKAPRYEALCKLV